MNNLEKGVLLMLGVLGETAEKLENAHFEIENAVDEKNRVLTVNAENKLYFTKVISELEGANEEKAGRIKQLETEKPVKSSKKIHELRRKLNHAEANARGLKERANAAEERADNLSRELNKREIMIEQYHSDEIARASNANLEALAKVVNAEIEKRSKQ